MTTIEVPDELAVEIEQMKDSWPELLAYRLKPPPLPAEIYRYVLEFIASRPTPEQIAAFRATPEMIERTRVLLTRERDGTATRDEKAELDEYERIQHVVVMLKAGNLPYLTQTP
jgi:hypothetical protein